MSGVGFIGLGRMGAAIAGRLEDGATRLHVHDPVGSAMQPFVDRGADPCATPRDVADRAEIVFACLPDPATSNAVADEVACGSAVRVYVEMSTIGRAAIEDIAIRMATCGIAVVDAPVSGGPARARAGQLAVMVAGKSVAVDRVRPLLSRIAGRLFDVGERPGQAQTMKLVNNLTAAALIAVTTEAMAIGVAAGLDPATMAAVLEAGSGQSSVTGFLLPAYVLREIEFGAAIATMMKDVDLGRAEAAPGASTPVIDTVAREWRNAGATIGWSEDLTRFMRDRLRPPA